MNLESLQLDEGTRKLIFVLCLPLVDGVFATLLITGALKTFSSMLTIGLTVFSGAGALTILYSYSDSVEEARHMVSRAFPVLMIGALAVALVAPIFEQLFFVERLQYAAGLALLVIAAQLADLPGSEMLSTPAIIFTGLLLSVHNLGALAFSLFPGGFGLFPGGLGFFDRLAERVAHLREGAIQRPDLVLTLGRQVDVEVACPHLVRASGEPTE
ncbi:MAG: DUF5794 domain-containing protein [Candidatus Nanohaloarchaea archaeon]